MSWDKRMADEHIKERDARLVSASTLEHSLNPRYRRRHDFLLGRQFGEWYLEW